MDSWRHAAAALVTDLQRCSPAVSARSSPTARASKARQRRRSRAWPWSIRAGVTDLDACAKLAHQWERHGLAIPLILPDQEFRRSLDAFPLEYAEIMRAHERVFGGDPFDGVSISREDLRRACETQVKSHLLHLREGFIETGGRPQAVADLVRASAPAFAALLRNVARLNGGASRGARRRHARGRPAAGLADAHRRRRPGARSTGDDSDRPTPHGSSRTYLAAVEQLARAVDSWRA